MANELIIPENRASGAKFTLSKTQAQKIHAGLVEPFDPELLFWKPQATNKDKSRAVAAVYADPRAYIDRLNEVCGHDGWEESYRVVISPFSAEKGWNTEKRIVSGHKILVECTLTIHGFGTHTDVGESDAGEENAATSAYSQAFKRACVKFGLGRYLYEFPKDQWCEYDKATRKITNPPAIPDWAMPHKKCSDCHETVKPHSFATSSGLRSLTVSEVLANGKAKYGQELCVECQIKRASAGKAAAGSRLE